MIISTIGQASRAVRLGGPARTIRMGGLAHGHPPHGRCFSARAIYSAFPATLHYYSPRPRLGLFDHKEYDSCSDDIFYDGVVVDENGLVYPGADTKSLTSNGATMQPNTFFMQETVRHFYDYAMDLQDEGKSVETPFIFTVPKGTPIPSHLILINEVVATFSLQPSHAMSLKDLNRSLNEFYDKNAIKETADAWLQKHPFQDAVPSEPEEAWMAK